MNRISLYSLLLFLIVGMIGCAEKPGKAIEESSKSVESKMDTKNASVLDIKDCLPELKSTGNLYDQMGSIYLVGDVFVILTENEAIRYHACNLPMSYRIDGLGVTFSIVTKEIPANAKMVGFPAVLTKIKIN